MFGITDPGLVGSFEQISSILHPDVALRLHGRPADSSHSTHRALTTQLKRRTPTIIDQLSATLRIPFRMRSNSALLATYYAKHLAKHWTTN